ncbi:unnamed protein product [Spirodela intermedia]|uniref:Uncharacterized protein n=1 Tax=Spirodela intermedia TaxID=51605 RepID=A0A7I8JSL9_SPIIN|nr:unnamed protein product [Spirodela intermedia]CAA6673176.1 unnamed protein product [Spirodela intermedia]
MSPFVNRLNTLVTFAVLLLAILCAGASFLDCFHSPAVQANVEVLKVNRFRRQLTGNDEVLLTLNMSIDLQSAFSWNTKQVFVFIAAEYETEKNAFNQVVPYLPVDLVISDKHHAKFETQVTSKYLLIDQGSNLRGKRVDLVLHWHAMPITGRMILGRSLFRVSSSQGLHIVLLGMSTPPLLFLLVAWLVGFIQGRSLTRAWWKQVLLDERARERERE